MRLVRLMLPALLAVCLPSAALAAPPSPAASGTAHTVFVSPAGSGTSCSSADPCSSVSAALAAAGPGGQVLLGSGRYPSMTLDASNILTQATTDVVVSPAPGAKPVLAGVRTSAAHVMFSRVDVTGAFYFTAGATGSSLVDSHVHGASASVLVRGSHITVRHDLIEGGHAHDGLNIAGQPGVNTGVRIVGNTVRDFTEGTPTQEHADCIQLFDTTHVLIERNRLYGCYASGIRFSPGARLGVSAVRIESNFIQGCLPDRQHCPSSVAADLRYPATGVTLTHNTFGHGIVFLPRSGITADDDIVGYLSGDDCSSILRNSVVVYFLPWTCPSRVPGRHNTQQSVIYADPDRGNLHLRSVIQRTTELQTTSTAGRNRDIDGQVFTTTVPGADQP